MSALGRLSITVLGPLCVGKSALIFRFLTKKFIENNDPTIEDNYQRTYRYKNARAKHDVVVLLDITDTSGQEEFSILADSYIRKSDGIILVYNMIALHTMFPLVAMYRKIEQRRAMNTGLCPVIVVGTHLDILNHQNRRNHIPLAKLPEELSNSPHMQVSSLDGTGVEEVFHKIVEIMIQSKISMGQSESLINASNPVWIVSEEEEGGRRTKEKKSSDSIKFSDNKHRSCELV